MKKILTNLIKISLTFSILWYLYSKGLLDFSRVKGVLSNPKIIFWGTATLLFSTVATVFRWQWLLKGQNFSIPLTQAFKLSMIGIFFNTAIPGAVSGDLVKGYYVVKQQPDGKGKIRAFMTLLMDRILGLTALITVAFAAMILNLKTMLSNPLLNPLCGLVSLLWLGVLAFYMFVLVDLKVFRTIESILQKLPKIGPLAGRVFESFRAYQNCKAYILNGFLISICTHSSLVLLFLKLSEALGGFESVPKNTFFLLIPIGLLVTAVPIAPAGLGTGHAAFLALFNLSGSSRGADLFTAFVSFQILISLFGGLFYIRYKHENPGIGNNEDQMSDLSLDSLENNAATK